MRTLTLEEQIKELEEEYKRLEKENAEIQKRMDEIATQAEELEKLLKEKNLVSPEQFEEIKNLEIKNRYEMLDTIAAIIGAEVKEMRFFTRNAVKTVVKNGYGLCLTMTMKKGKVKELYFYKPETRQSVTYRF